MSLFDGLFGSSSTGATSPLLGGLLGGPSSTDSTSSLLSDPTFLAGLQILSNSMVKRPLTAQVSPLQGVPELIAAASKAKNDADVQKKLASLDPGKLAASYLPSSGGGQSASPTTNPGGVGGLGGFDGAVNRTLGFEGGYTSNDSNGSPANFGINQAANPDVDVKNLTQDQAKQLYKTRYWDPIGGDQLAQQNPALARVAFDASVNSGPERAKEWLAQSGGDPNKFLDIRQNFLNGLLQSNPDKYAPYAKSWMGRINGLRQDIAGMSAGQQPTQVASADPNFVPGAPTAPAGTAVNPNLKTPLLNNGQGLSQIPDSRVVPANAASPQQPAPAATQVASLPANPDKFDEDNPDQNSDIAKLPDGSIKVSASPQGLAWAAQNAGKYGLQPDPQDPTHFVPMAASAGAPAAPAAPAQVAQTAVPAPASSQPRGPATPAATVSFLQAQGVPVTGNAAMDQMRAQAAAKVKAYGQVIQAYSAAGKTPPPNYTAQYNDNLKLLQPTDVEQALMSAGVQPGTPEYQKAMLKKAGIGPTEFQEKLDQAFPDPNDPRRQVAAQTALQMGPSDALKKIGELQKLGVMSPSDSDYKENVQSLYGLKDTTKTPSFGVIGKNSLGQDVYGWRDPMTQKVTPYVQPNDGENKTPIDPSLTGDGFLQTLDPARQNTIKQMVEGRSPPPSAAALRSPYIQQLIQQANQYDPSFDETKWAQRVATRREFNAGGPNSPASIITAGNTAIQHLGHLSDAAQNLNNTSFTPYNSIANFVSQKMGDPAVDTFNDWRNRYIQEVTKFYRGTGGNEADMKRDIDALNDAKSPAQLQSVIAAQADGIRSKINALQDRWHLGMGPQVGDFPIVQPESQKALDKIEQRYLGVASPSGQSAPQAAGPTPPMGQEGQQQGTARQAIPATAQNLQGMKKAPDGNWYVPDPSRPGKYLQVVP